MPNDETRTPKSTEVITREVVMPQHANPQQTLFGGQMVCWIDMVAGMAARRHACGPIVTASIDNLSFTEPVFVGDILLLQAKVNYVGRTSMEVGVKVSVEHLYTGQFTPVTRAYLTFVALDENRRPRPVPRLRCETEDDKRRYDNGRMRMEARKDLVRRLAG